MGQYIMHGIYYGGRSQHILLLLRLYIIRDGCPRHIIMEIYSIVVVAAADPVFFISLFSLCGGVPVVTCWCPKKSKLKKIPESGHRCGG